MNSNSYFGYGNGQLTTNQDMVGQQPQAAPLPNGTILHYDSNFPNGWFDQYLNWYPVVPSPPVQQPQQFFDGVLDIDTLNTYVPLEQAPSPAPPPIDPVFPIQMRTSPVPLAPTPLPAASPAIPPAMPAAPVNNSSSVNVLPPFPDVSATTPHPTVKVQLRDQWLWNKFHEKTNEMIVTLQGKQIFPRIAYIVTGLNGRSRYQWSIRLVRVSPYEMKWNSEKFIWQPTEVHDNGTLESNELLSDVKSGEEWEKEGVNYFDKTKVYNSVSDQNKDKVLVKKETKLDNENKLLVKQRYSYQPVLSLHEISEQGGQMMVTQRGSFQFTETGFVVVTQYKSTTIKAMKTKYNNFNSKGKQEKASMELESAEEQLRGSTGYDSGYLTSSPESTVSPMVASPEASSYSAQYFGFDGSAPTTSNYY